MEFITVRYHGHPEQHENGMLRQEVGTEAFNEPGSI